MHIGSAAYLLSFHSAMTVALQFIKLPFDSNLVIREQVFVMHESHSHSKHSGATHI